MSKNQEEPDRFTQSHEGTKRSWIREILDLVIATPNREKSREIQVHPTNSGLFVAESGRIRLNRTDSCSELDWSSRGRLEWILGERKPDGFGRLGVPGPSKGIGKRRVGVNPTGSG
jgi:hypothetical protein